MIVFILIKVNELSLVSSATPVALTRSLALQAVGSEEGMA